MASEPGDAAAAGAKVAASDTAENHANAPVERAPDDGSKLKTLLGLLRKYAWPRFVVFVIGVGGCRKCIGR
jgi:hypothetical protein